MGDKNKKKKAHQENKRSQRNDRKEKQESDSSRQQHKKTKEQILSKEKTVDEPTKEVKTIDYQRESKKSKHKSKDRDNSPLTVIKNQPLDVSGVVAKYQKANKGHVVDRFLAAYPQYSMFGDNIPLAEETFLADIEESKFKVEFKKGDEFTTENYTFKLLKPTGRRNMYYVHTESDFVFLMKVESLTTKPRDSLLERELLVRDSNRKVSELFQKHILGYVGHGQIDGLCHFLVMHIGTRDLVDLRAKLGKYTEYLPRDAVRINIQTLQAIHDVHLCRFVHRDIHPRNFQIGLFKASNVVYVFNFGLSYQYHSKNKHVSILAKLAKLSRTFQPRVFHTGLEYNCLSDMESWLYMCYWICDGRSIGNLWRKEREDVDERKMCNAKELFFHGLYDEHFVKLLGPVVCKYLGAMRHKIKVETAVPSLGHVNYAFFGETLLALARELKVDWQEPYQWQDYVPSAQGVKAKFERPKQTIAEPATTDSDANEKTGPAKALVDSKDGKTVALNDLAAQSDEKHKKKKKNWQCIQTEDEETKDSSSSSAQTTSKNK